MNNTDKLLRALIDALGFEITKEFDQRKYNYEVALANERNEAPILTKADFTDYKLARKGVGIKCKKCGTHLAQSSPLNACLCRNSENLIRIEHE